jgi:sirohydrochlorin cobaltochelatase
MGVSESEGESESGSESEVTAIVLVAHGSPDPDWRRPIEAVVRRLREKEPARTVVVAYLGFLEPSFGQAMEELVAAGHRRVLVLSAFLSPGGRHIKEDVPKLVTEQAAVHPGVVIELRPGALGAEPEVVEAMAEAAARAVVEAGASDRADQALAGGSTNADASTS